MSRAAPFLIDDLLPEGVRLHAVRSVECSRIPAARSVVALTIAAGQEARLRSRLAGLGSSVAVLVAAEGSRAGEEAARALADRRLPGLVLVLEAQAGVDWVGRLRTLARRLVPQAALPEEAKPMPGAAASRYLAKMRELEVLIDPEAAEAPAGERILDEARSWRSRLHARAVTRFLHRQGRSSLHAARLLDRTATAREMTGGFGTLWAALDPERPPRPLGSEDMAREEALLDGFIAQEKARQAALVRPAPWRGHGRLAGVGLRA
ncbi:hypothetical protein DWF04_014515 [Cereibacter sphaeroides f. sp. denitrificans]|nr:hypothetical protein DWF04_17415 [Cereibacter sphaeroides f. sp. denitrificans]